jgi:4,5-DOPA dioxygenase extradiol
MIPSFFVAHGAPLLAIETHAYTRFLNERRAGMVRPKAVVVFSAHWESSIQQVSDARRHSMIYDFSGFPDELYQIRYPAQGEPSVAAEIQGLLERHGIGCETDDARGLDHGAWVVLRLLYPEADVPVIAMSVNSKLVPEEHYRIGRALASLRERDVLIVGSGGTVHNLRKLEWNQTKASPWAIQFDDWLADQLEQWNVEALFDYAARAPYAKEAVPTPEHFVPLIIAMGAADDAKKAKLLYRGYQYGSLSLSCWQFG